MFVKRFNEYLQTTARFTVTHTSVHRYERTQTDPTGRPNRFRQDKLFTPTMNTNVFLCNSVSNDFGIHNIVLTRGSPAVRTG